MTYRWLLLLCCISCAHQGNLPATFEASVLQGRGNLVEAVASGDSVIIAVSGEKGIGRASVRLTSGQWPEKTKIRLYLKGLEGLNISTAKQALDISQLAVRTFDMRGNVLQDQDLLNKTGYFEVQLPTGLITDTTDSVGIQWVDFYR